VTTTARRGPTDCAVRCCGSGSSRRHDCVSASRYFADALESPPALRLAAPVTVVVAADDPSTAEFRGRHRDWQLLAEHVDLHELADGGHDFVRTRPAEAAKAVLSASELLVSNLSSSD
jgi:pimeloyl-ACP methyl ester carboxylesterase